MLLTFAQIKKVTVYSAFNCKKYYIYYMQKYHSEPFSLLLEGNMKLGIKNVICIIYSRNAS